MTTTLFTPLKLKNGFEIKNRFMKAATSETLGSADNRPTPPLNNLYRTWAKGGTGLIITGNVMVDDTAKGEFGNVVVEDDRDLRALKNWASSVTDNDGAIFMQLNHPGKQSPRTMSKTPVAPSVVPMEGSNAFAFNNPRALNRSEIKDIVQKFINAAVVAQKAGFSGVEIHAAHGYLLNQFLSPHDNRRVDEYGGSLENRMRILEEIYLGMREKVGADFPIALKINSSDLSADGFSEADSIKVIQKMDQLGIDLIEISGGNYENPLVQGIGKGAFFIDYAKKIKQMIDAPIAVTGGFSTAEGMENAIDSDGTDIVGLARPLVMMPDIPNLMKAGRFHKIDLHYLSTGLKPLDKKVGSLVGLSFYQQQMDRTAHGKSTQRDTENAWGALGFSFKRQGLSALIPQRG
ncbi:NADH:flavin oxidoreductase/NADH oxidase family protein [Companilactobacillus sp.]|jgi:2,4-dienoyl-CoA reductase-like NADH-dependent reductase (Old Yellow Enzyme family)|uniref:NADH:flavin oxidoreductase/NADH oxidase family protein n=1 Tax=Companilactobacillus sp. TaxID=2767905 RepID=UPI0025C1F47B|nr:NADH:flavin oxidoreductase/NADH oxidase family protein [Companilactobacillus sp.]MCH4009715.1 NADH:flavin oxidoreductase/NADH oxidase family protein [Companilactobacillus sp.]MCH4052609.1 NADH:flavin oxidoreductase/NADH oxidase family protein [Companilactobacillus sp.]MCH4077657.1 NADH:flavin oxidoreductase/NADH oxidase family protein [Companilactobacillus sp.]MCH4126233.1 NADH:flavin oxidoreductase/NADH oxidase family protein [Companilactobacillus sp.]MCI1311941.1 NADH:flavin oxidoreductas